jgi:3-phenylpropionate/cinnamic acid dioxygenase small subunit
METHDRRVFDDWIANWSDLAEFEVRSVISSKEAAEKIEPRL